MTAYRIEPPIRRWYCPACGLQDVTKTVQMVVPGHVCPRTRGLSIPLVPEGVAAKVEVREREDYVGADAGKVQLDPELHRPVMSVVTTRDNGNDAQVYVPVATARVVQE